MTNKAIVFIYNYDKVIVEGMPFFVNVTAGEVVTCDGNGYVHIFGQNDDDAGTIAVKASSLVDNGYAVYHNEKELHLAREDAGKFIVKE